MDTTNNHTTTLVWNTDVLPASEDIPNDAHTLVIGHEFNQTLSRYDMLDNIIWFFTGRKSRKSHIPSSVTTLILNGYSQQLQVGDIPNNVTRLSICGPFDNSLQVGHIPDSVTCLILGDIKYFAMAPNPGEPITPIIYKSFDQELKVGCIPDSVTTLVFGHAFNRKLQVGHIPDSVVDLIFGMRFNRKLEKGHIPDSVVNLTFGSAFSQVLEPEILPTNLESLTCHDNLATILSKVPQYIQVYAGSYFDGQKIELSDVRHLVRVKSGSLDEDIINGEIDGVYYVDTVEENNTKYLLVRGNDYLHVPPVKSANK